MFQQSCVHLSNKWTLLIDIVAILSLSRNFESQTWIAEESRFRSLQASLLVQENGGLLLKSPLETISNRRLKWQIRSVNT